MDRRQNQNTTTEKAVRLHSPVARPTGRYTSLTCNVRPISLCSQTLMSQEGEKEHQLRKGNILMATPCTYQYHMSVHVHGYVCMYVYSVCVT